MWNIKEASCFLSISRYSKGNILILITERNDVLFPVWEFWDVVSWRSFLFFFCAQLLLCEVLYVIESSVLILSYLSRENAASRTQYVRIGAANGFSHSCEPNRLKSMTELESEGC